MALDYQQYIAFMQNGMEWDSSSKPLQLFHLMHIEKIRLKDKQGTNRETLESHWAGFPHKQYYYKTLLLDRAMKENSYLITEVRLRNAYADAIAIAPDGTMTAIEIKSEFDTPRLLKRELKAYYKAFPLATILCHESNAKKMMDVCEYPSAGIQIIKDGIIETIREPIYYPNELDIGAMHVILTRKEKELVLKTMLDVKADKSCDWFNFYRTLFNCINPLDMQPSLKDILPQRKKLDREFIERLPMLLRYVAYSSQGSRFVSKEKILEWLDG